MKYALGLDIGSVNVKLALMAEDGTAACLDEEKIVSNARAAVNALLSRLDGQFPLARIGHVGVTGSGKSVIPRELGWAEYSSALALASGLLQHHADARTIIQIGGQSSLVITLADGLREPWKVTSNPLCAAGTGRFLEQQAYRIGVSMADFASLALQCDESPPRIAARCSVFAKSDLIHLQQKGVQVPPMLYALCESIARMVSSLHKGTFAEPVYFVGGVAANGAIRRALNDMLSARNGHSVEVCVPQNSLHIQSMGAALLSLDKPAQARSLPQSDAGQQYFQTPVLEKVALPGNGGKLAISQPCKGYLGVDVGSTSTKAVILDETGCIVAKSYLMTAGRPIEAVKQVFRNLLSHGSAHVSLAGAGVTGSGRYLVGGFIGADLIKNEITAQTRAAVEIDAEADIIEIGGQDSKLVIKRNGVVVDYQMNKACAAGTGSFVDELAEMLDVSVTNGDFARLAFNAPHTIDLGTRCAAFMGQSVASAQQEGISLEIITASLANSIAKNYLSKVLGNRKLGSRVILTGAVFYNEAIVSAFKGQLPDKALTVAAHREVSGAIGAALLAREAMSGQRSKFKGLQAVIEGECKLSTFVCKGCDNNCTITRMQMSDDKQAFFGSRCDKYDSALARGPQQTPFDEREKLLLAGIKEGSPTAPRVGIPRALLVYDFAPLLISYLNKLGARVVLSSKTTRQIIEQAVELSYTDSCFPFKLAHGHVASLKDTDYILYPSAIRLGVKEGDEDQKYSCPLVQASPYIIREVLDLGQKLISPIIDFSLGDTEVIKNLAEAAVLMGFSRGQGRRAARAALESQQSFEAERRTLGAALLERIRKGNELGVVLLSRSYMSQDSGANLGIAEKLAQLGVVPVPLDFLPLHTVNPRDYSDRPFWSYESKLIAAAAIIAQSPRLYGLALTNFGCGPNSFILKLLEDIMGGKPMGQMEIDEHAAEAGIVTRLEAFVDTIRSYAASATPQHVPAEAIRRGSTSVTTARKTLVVPRMAPFVDVIAALMQSSGVEVITLPAPDERSLAYANGVTSGTECLPYRVTLGDFLKFCYENPGMTGDVELMMASSYGPCRLGKYALEQSRIMQEAGFDIPIRSTVSNSAYRDLNLGADTLRIAMQGIFAVDLLEKMLWRSRPYEKEKGLGDNLFGEYLNLMCRSIGKNGDLTAVLKKASAAFGSAMDTRLPRRPLVGINGEIFLRSNTFSNNNMVRVCEDAGLEVMVSPIGEWIKYTSYRHLEDTIRFRKTRKILGSYIKNEIIKGDERRVQACSGELLDGREPSISEVLDRTKPYLSPRCGSEAVLSIGAGIEWIESARFAGVISVMPHGCMPGGIVAALADKLGQKYHKPWISLTYDGIHESNNAARINEFAELVKFSGAAARVLDK